MSERAPLSLVVAGAGANVWRMHEPGVDAIGARVVAVHDVDRDAAARIAAERDCASAATLDELLEQDADVAVVLTPHVTHAEVAIRCLREGRHVLVEKPVAARVQDAEAMVAAAERAGVLLAVCLQQRTRHEVVAARRLIGAQELGELQRADLLATWPRRASYFRTAPWRATWSGEGGGILINQGQHDLDLLCHLAGAPSAVVAARTSSAIHGLEVEDTATALLAYEGGATGTLRISSAEAGEPQRIDLAGTRARLRLSPGRLEIWRNRHDFRTYAAGPGDPYAPPEVAPVETVNGGGGSHADLYRNLADAVAGRAPLVAPGGPASAAVELANALVLSAYERREVALPVDRAASARLLERLAGEPRTDPRPAPVAANTGGEA